MGVVIVRNNKLPKISREAKGLRAAIKTESSQILVEALSAGAVSRWKSNTIAGTVKDRSRSKYKAKISIGLNRGLGFYSRFLEWGTKKNAPRPMVTPTVEAAWPDIVGKAANRTSEALR